MSEIHAKHAHYAALCLLVEVVETQVYAVGKCWLQVGVTNHYVQWVRHIGHRLQLRERRLAAAHAVVETQRACACEAVAETCIRSHRPHPVRRYVASRVHAVLAARHCRVDRSSEVQVILLAHLAEANGKSLVKIFVGKVITLSFVQVAVKLRAKLQAEHSAQQLSVRQHIRPILLPYRAAQVGVSEHRQQCEVVVAVQRAAAQRAVGGARYVIHHLVGCAVAVVAAI